MPRSAGTASKALLSSGALKIASQIISWAVTIYALRTLSPQDYGWVATIIAISGLVLPFADNPLVLALVRKRSVGSQFLAQFSAYCYALSSIVACLAFVGCLVYALANQNHSLIPIAAIMCCGYAMIGLKVIPEAMLLRDQRISERAFGLFIEAIVSSLTVLAFVYKGFGVYALAIGPTVGALAKIIFFRIITGTKVAPKFSWPRSKRLFHWTRGASLNEAALYFTGNGPVLAASVVSSPIALGLFTTSLFLVNTITGKLMQVSNPVITSIFSRSQTDSSKAAQLAPIGLGYLMLLAAPLYIGLAAVSKPFVLVVLGEKWAEASFVVSLLALIMPLRVCFEYLATIMKARGKERQLFKLQLIAIAPLCLSLLVGGLFDFRIMVISFFVVNLVVTSFNLTLAIWVLKLPVRFTGLTIAYPVASGLAMGVWVHFVPHFLPADQSLKVSLIVQIVSGVLFLLPFAWLLRRWLVARTIVLAKLEESDLQLRPTGPLHLNRISQSSVKQGSASLSIFTFHQVLKAQDSNFPNYPTRHQFERLVIEMSRHYEFVGLDEGIERLASGEKKSKLASITFDDGYVDNLDIAAPILAALNIPMTIFMSTAHFSGESFFVDVVEQSLLKTKKGSVDAKFLGLGQLSLSSIDKRIQTCESILQALKYVAPDDRNEFAQKLWHILEKPLLKNILIQKSDQKKLAGLNIQFGAHTHTHSIMTTVDESFLSQDIHQNCQAIAEFCGQWPTLFAYPNGKPIRDFNADHVSLIKQLGFKAAFSTAGQICTSDSDQYQIPRMSLGFRSPRFARIRQDLLLARLNS
jgi:O-antigen/teichoic acid export membrane protein/peptidoglycan/xylan/chitin deacetylase (PgdA/CDA1 family)